MTKPQGSATFLKNDGDFLWFSLTCRETRIPASVRLKIKDEVLALDLDNAVTLRLLRFDNKKEADHYNFWRQMFGGDPVESDEILDADQLIRNDPYADENTIVS